MSQKDDPKEGTFVSYKKIMYWVCEVRGSRIRLLPMDAIDFDDMRYELGRAFEVDLDKVSVVETAG